MKNKLKILHLPTTVGGNPQGLSKAEKELGFSSHTLCITQNYLAYNVDEIVLKGKNRRLTDELFIFWAAIKSLLRGYDVHHYNFGKSLSPARHYSKVSNFSKWKVFLYTDVYARVFELWDVKLAKLMGKTVLVTYQGSDARQSSYCRNNYPIHYFHDLKDDYDNQEDSFKRGRIKVFSKHADFIYSVNPDLLNVLPKRAKFTPYASVDYRDWKNIGVSENLEIPHIVHAPSNRTIKGTKFILDAFERLEEDNISFRYTLVENMPNPEACKVYETADLLVDQLLAGYYGGVAVELMSLGKPVICYMREEDMVHLPKEMWAECPIINSTPNDIYKVLKEWLLDKKDKLAEQGQKSRAYVEKWHDPQKIAQSIIDDCNQV